MTDKQQTRMQAHDVLHASYLHGMQSVDIWLQLPSHAGSGEGLGQTLATLTFPVPGNPRMVEVEYEGTLPPLCQRWIDQLLCWLRTTVTPTGKPWRGMPRWMPEIRLTSVLVTPVPCSVCGGPAVIYQEAYEPQRWFGSCDGDTDACVKGHTDDYATRDETVDEWNAIHGDASAHDATEDKSPGGKPPGDKSVTLSPCPKCKQKATVRPAVLGELPGGWHWAGCLSTIGYSAGGHARRGSSSGKAIAAWERWVAEENLLPCPKCGKQPEAYTSGTISGRWAVSCCVEADARASLAETESEAIVRWQKHVAGQPTRAAEPEILPCRECESAGRVWEGWLGQGEKGWYAGCTNTGLHPIGDSSESGVTRAKAIAAWNEAQQRSPVGHNGHTRVEAHTVQCLLCHGLGEADYRVASTPDLEFRAEASDVPLGLKQETERKTCHMCEGAGKVRQWKPAFNGRPRHVTTPVGR